MALEYWPFYHSYIKKMAKLSDQEVGRVVRALNTYSETGEAQELAGRDAVAFDFIADDIDRAKASYEEKCRKNSANASERYRPHANASDGTKDKDKTEDENKNKPLKGGEESRAPARFVPPTEDEVAAYCTESGHRIDVEAFIDHYTANGWKVGGKSPMKDWKAAVRNWERGDNLRGGKHSRHTYGESSRAPTADDNKALEQLARLRQKMVGE